MVTPRSRFGFDIKRDTSQIGADENLIADQALLISADCFADLRRNRGC